MELDVFKYSVYYFSFSHPYVFGQIIYYVVFLCLLSFKQIYNPLNVLEDNLP